MLLQDLRQLKSKTSPQLFGALRRGQTVLFAPIAKGPFFKFVVLRFVKHGDSLFWQSALRLTVVHRSLIHNCLIIVLHAPLSFF